MVFLLLLDLATEVLKEKINAIKYVREKQHSILGICLGMQCAVVEFARNILSKSNANSTEMNPNTKYPVIDIMEKTKKIFKIKEGQCV